MPQMTMAFLEDARDRYDDLKYKSIKTDVEKDILSWLITQFGNPEEDLTTWLTNWDSFYQLSTVEQSSYLSRIGNLHKRNVNKEWL